MKPINWFEIPATDLARSRTFYEKTLQVTLIPHEGTMAVFPYDRASGTVTGGCVMTGPQPSQSGVVIYLNAGSSLDATLERAVAAGGSIALPRTALPPGMGFFAHIIDSEGNRIGLHALAA